MKKSEKQKGREKLAPEPLLIKKEDN